MIVKELIEELNKLPQDARIQFQSYDEYFDAKIVYEEGSWRDPYIYLTKTANKGRTIEMIG